MKNAPIYLKWGETLIAEKMVELGKEDETQKVSILHTFTIADDYNITIEIPKQVGEFTEDNNLRRHNIKIIQQKLTFRIGFGNNIVTKTITMMMSS